jgi:hypothetical protein
MGGQHDPYVHDVGDLLHGHGPSAGLLRAAATKLVGLDKPLWIKHLA